MHVGEYAGDPAQWDTFVRGQLGWTHCHLFAWKGVMEDAMRHECVYLAAWDDQRRLAGVLPLVRVKSLLFGHYLVSMPFLNYGGPLGRDAAVGALAEHATALSRQSAADLLELRSRRAFPIGLDVSHRKVTVLLDLSPGDPDAVFQGFSAKLRSQVRRPTKEGVTTRFGADQVEPFYRVFARHMRDLGTPVQSRGLFEAIARTFGDDAWFGCAYLGDAPIACGAGFRWGDEFEMTWASSLVEYNRIAPNMLLYWSFMERAANQGLKVFNFGRCTPGSGTHKFKLQWGGRDDPLFWYRQARGGRVKTPSPDDGAYSLGPRLWRRLPLGIANTLGPRIVRGIP
jgi:FemAB-related protein (PEP-CTERM system-associated)